MSNSHISNKKWKKNVYTPINTSKYKGSKVIITRSSWEYKFARFLDLNPNVLEWISEEPTIPYLNPNTQTVWRYFPDFTVVLKTQTGIKTQMIEIKPKKQTIPPTVSSGKHRRTLLKEAQTWAMNQAKWKNAKAYCDQRGWEFKILTEDDLFC